jgi:hypothetical protein
LLIAVLVGPPAAADEAAPEKTTTEKPAAKELSAEEARQLEEQVAKIERAIKPGEAAAAYTAARTIDRKSPKVYRAYIRWMLRYGLPQIAYPAANELVRLDREDGLAWGVIGYMLGRQNRLAEAGRALVRAAEAEETNKGVMNNLGILSGWYDSDPQAKQQLPSEVTAALYAHKKEWSKQEGFERGHKRASAIVKKREEEKRKWEQRIAEAKKDLEPLRKEIDELLREYHDARRDWEHHRNRRNSHQRDLNDVNRQIDERRKDDKNTRDLEKRRNRLRDDINDEEKEMRKHADRGRDIDRKGRDRRGDYEEKRAELRKLEHESRQALTEGRLAFPWTPPAVNGAIVPQRENFVMKALPGRVFTGDEEARAAKRLQIAKLYLKNKLPEKARELLQDIVDRWEESEAGKEAKVLLESLSK